MPGQLPGQGVLQDPDTGEAALWRSPLLGKLLCKSLVRGTRWNQEEENPALLQCPSSALY